MDGFHQDGGTGEADECGEACCGLFSSQGDAFEALELSDGLLDAGAQAVDALGKEAIAVLCGAAAGDDRRDTAHERGGRVSFLRSRFERRQGDVESPEALGRERQHAAAVPRDEGEHFQNSLSAVL